MNFYLKGEDHIGSHPLSMLLDISFSEKDNNIHKLIKELFKEWL